MITIYINGIKIEVLKSITVLEACKKLDIEIPKFCFHENLQIAGNCRMCLVEIENSLKPVAACAMPVINNMKIFTDTPLVKKARESILEFLLINHPLDCPICDQASECDLQEHTMNYGSDKSRFFFNKRVVEDKYCGPFIKTIMTRCIHCTRCVRFVNEICKIDNLGTIGRGKKTEIGFYNNNSIFTSEFSGNLIDLCPVGALTSKPYTFKARYWELKKYEVVDIMDSSCSNIKVDVFNNEILRILPKTNYNINNEWISNKTRFFFDSLKYQRILNPLYKDKNNKFKKISWLKAFSIVNNKLMLTDASNIQVIIGDLVDLESLFILKKKFYQIGINNIKFEKNLKDFPINSDLTSNFLINNIKTINQNCNLCIIIKSNIRNEVPILNIHLINRLKKGNFKIAYIGSKIDLTYNYYHLGNSLNILVDIVIGKHFFCRKIKKTKNTIFIVGEMILHIKNGIYLINKLTNLSFLNKKNINFLNNKTSLINFLEITFNKRKLNKNHSNVYYLYNTNLKKDLSFVKDNFLIYQGHHFNDDAQNSNLVLPGVSFFEKEGTYLNFEGWIQKNKKILNLKTNQKEDMLIYKYLYKFILIKNSTKNIIKFFKYIEILPYLLKKKLKFFELKFLFQTKFSCKINTLVNNNNLYYNNINIFEEFSKILVNSKKIINKKKKKFINYDI